MNKKTRIGSTLESFLEQEGIREDVYAEAAKKIVALQLREAMKETGTTVSEMARRMATSRSQVERVIALESGSVTVVSLARAASAVGYKLNMNLVKARSKTGLTRISKRSVRASSPGKKRKTENRVHA
jgi:antitoxin HicB